MSVYGAIDNGDTIKKGGDFYGKYGSTIRAA